LQPLTWLWLFGAGLVSVLLSVPDFNFSDSDFRCFYLSARSWLDGTGMYSRTPLIDTNGIACGPNLNPPWFAALLSPLTALPIGGAFAVWTALNLALVLTTIRRILIARPEVPWQALVLICFAFLPAWLSWRHGQVTWILFALITRAWLASSPVRAGLWLAPAIALKPPLALMAILLPWPIAAVAGTAAAMATVGLVIVMGVPVWAEWLLLSDSVNRLGWPTNTSLWGLAVRLEHGSVYGGLADLSVVSLTLVLLSAVGLGAWTLRSAGDVRWTRAFLWGLLLSPLGWLHHLPEIAGPLLAAAYLPRLVWAVPIVILPRVAYFTWIAYGGWVSVALSCLYIGVVAIAWSATLRPRTRS
jgi:alpha-1,2-mannosyltransferase